MTFGPSSKRPPTPHRRRIGGARVAIAIAALAVAAGLSGCASYYYGDSAGRVDPIQLNYRAADALLAGAGVDFRQPVLVTTLVHVDALDQSSRLGRLFSEQIAARLVQGGLTVRELKLREQLVVDRYQGELMLSRDTLAISRQHDAQAVLVGTYAPGGTTVYVNLKLVSPVTGRVISAVDYAVPLDANMRALLTY